MDEEKLVEYTVKQLRLLRHNFMNTLQVIYAYLQINKPDKAIEYMKEINKNMFSLSLIYNLENPFISLLMQDIIMEVEKMGADYEIITNIDYIPTEVFTKNKNEILTLFENIKKYLLNGLKGNNVSKKLYIEIGEDDKAYLIDFYNTGLKEKIKSTNYETPYKIDGLNLRLYEFGNSFLLEVSIEKSRWLYVRRCC